MPCESMEVWKHGDVQTCRREKYRKCVDIWTYGVVSPSNAMLAHMLVCVASTRGGVEE
jgi:hypothetical protein